MAALMLLAPRLPPTTRMVDIPVFMPKNSIASSFNTVECAISYRTGLPETNNVSEGKNLCMFSVATITKSAFLPSMILDFPAKEFDSCMNVEIPFCCAYFSTGKLEYPPTPKTASGLNSLNIFFTWMKLLINLNGRLQFARSLLLLNPTISIPFIS